MSVFKIAKNKMRVNETILSDWRHGLNISKPLDSDMWRFVDARDQLLYLHGYLGANPPCGIPLIVVFQYYFLH